MIFRGIILIVLVSCNANHDDNEGMIQQGYSYGSKSGKEPVFAENPRWVKDTCPHCGRIIYSDKVNGKIYHQNPVCKEFADEHSKQRRGPDILIKQ